MDTNKMHKEKTWGELHKNTVSCLQNILGTASHKTTVVRPLTFHLTNHSSKTNGTCMVLLENQGRFYK